MGHTYLDENVTSCCIDHTFNVELPFTKIKATKYITIERLDDGRILVSWEGGD